jgi:hypothetical protein
MFLFHGLIGTKDEIRDGQKFRYGWELVLFHKLRDWADGVTWFELVANTDKFVADHNPRFDFHLIVCNWTVFEFNVYNIHHSEEVPDGGACCVDEVC